ADLGRDLRLAGQRDGGAHQGPLRRERTAGQAAGRHPARGRPRHDPVPLRHGADVVSMDRRRFLTASALAAPALTVAAASPATADPAVAAPVAGPTTSGGHGQVTPAADLLAADGWRHLRGRKLGVLTNPTGVLRDQTHIVDSMVAADVRPTAVFGPEHGFRGTAQAGGSEGDYLDPRTQIPVYDAYAVTAEKLAELFTKAGIDTLVFDIADVGARFYTYIWSMYTAMHASVLTGTSVVVLDRPNPVGGRPYGPMLDPAFASGV